MIMSRGHGRSADAPELPLPAYLRDIGTTPLLTAEEEKELARRIQLGDQAARDQMVRANLRLVVKIARSFRGGRLSLEDLIEEGNLGLLRAVEGYDPSMNNRFSTYAAYWIIQSIQRASTARGKTIRVPPYAFQLLRKWRQVRATREEELGRPPTDEEMCAALELSAQKLDIVRKAARVLGSAEGTGQVEDTPPLEDVLVNHKTPRVENHAALQDDRCHILRLLDRLDEREAAVIRQRFGLSGEKPQTLAQVAQRLDLTRERVRQIEKLALQKLADLYPGGRA
jgi:RNA polymerase primary sigma factor